MTQDSGVNWAVRFPITWALGPSGGCVPGESPWLPLTLGVQAETGPRPTPCRSGPETRSSVAFALWMLPGGHRPDLTKSQNRFSPQALKAAGKCCSPRALCSLNKGSREPIDSVLETSIRELWSRDELQPTHAVSVYHPELRTVFPITRRCGKIRLA